MVYSTKDPFTPEIGEFITGDEATKMQATHLETQVNLKIKEPTRSVFFGINKIKRLIDKSSPVAGIKIYFVQNAEGKQTVVLTAADSNGQNIVSNKSGLKGDGDDYLDMGGLCPQDCPPQ
jgi:hypothetical protein